MDRDFADVAEEAPHQPEDRGPIVQKGIGLMVTRWKELRVLGGKIRTTHSNIVGPVSASQGRVRAAVRRLETRCRSGWRGTQTIYRGPISF